MNIEMSFGILAKKIEDPNNKRLQELYNKEDLTPEEIIERTKLHRLKEFTSHTVFLLEKIDNKDINTKLVDINGGNIIEYNEGMNEGKSILTYGLGGCTATVIYIGFKNGSKKVALTHFPPNISSILLNLEKIRNLIGNINQDDIEEVNCLYITPDIRSNDKNQNDSFLTALESQINQLFGNKYNGKTKKYYESLIFGTKDNGVLSIELNKNGVYCRHEGQFGQLDGFSKQNEEIKRIEEIRSSLIL